VEEILEEYGNELYTAPVPGPRRQRIQQQDLEDMPLLDEAGQEIPLYTNNGYQIERRLAGHSEGTNPHGVLMDLRHLNVLFHEDRIEDDYEDLDDGIELSPVKYYVYPQAGLVTAGHFQANGLMTNFQKRVNILNSRIHEELDAEHIVDAEQSQGVAIRGIGCQGYNAVMHCTRGLGSQHHDAQKGYVTGALSGAWARNDASMETIARRMQQRCEHQLPYETFDRKIDNLDIDRDLRLENVYSIDVLALPQAGRNGE
jgi:hypothetical protein